MMRKLLYLVFGISLLSGCAKDKEGEFSPDKTGEIRFSAGVGLHVETKAMINAVTGLDGESIGIFAVNTGTTKNVTSNPEWPAAAGTFHVTNEEGTVTGSTGAVATATLWYPGADYLDFYAYYPYNSDGTNKIKQFTDGNAPQLVFTLENANADNQTDFMYATPVYGKSTADDTTIPIGLNFKHALSSVKVSVQRAETTAPMAVVELKIKTAGPQSGKMDISDGTITADTGSGVTYAYTGSVTVPEANDDDDFSDDTLAEDVDSWLFLPGNSLAELYVKTDGGAVFTANLSGITLAPGKIKKIVLSFDEAQMAVVALTVEAWLDADEPLTPTRQ